MEWPPVLLLTAEFPSLLLGFCLSVSRGAPLPFGPSFALHLSRVDITSEDITFSFGNLLSLLIYLPYPSTVAAAQVTSGEKSTPLSLCGASDFRYCFPPPAAPKCGLTFLEHPQRLSRSPSDLPSPNRRLQRTHSPLWNSISPFSSPNRRPRDPATPPPEAYLQGYPPCPEHSPWGLGTHQPVSGSPLIPQGIWATQLQRDLLCPKPSHECLEPHPPRQPPSHLGPNPSGSCSGCGPLSLPLLAGLVAADAVVSLLIVVGVCVCGRPRSRPTQGEGRDGLGLKRVGVPREGGPQGGGPRASPGGSGETLGAVLGGTPEETPETGGPQGSGDVGGRWVVRPRALSPPPPEDGKIYINMPGRG